MVRSRNTDDDDDVDDGPKGKHNSTKRFEFDCPSCNANNPWPDGFVAKDEVICHYCGITYRVMITDEGRLKLLEL